MSTQPALSSTDPSVPPLSAAVPETVRMAWQPLTDATAARRYTWRLAHQHYENFTVVSHLVPRDLRQDFCNIYAFCRTADDLGDEVFDQALALRYLADFRHQTLDCYAGKVHTAVFTALTDTIQRHHLPVEPFLDLIAAFEQDQRVHRYETFPQLLDYCRRSADPVGRLVLYLCGYRDAQRQTLSDQTCTALQLTNFWQDVRRDLLQRDRVYLPAESLRRFHVSLEQLRQGRCDENYRQLLRFEVERTAVRFAEGERLLELIRPALRLPIALFSAGGLAVLEEIRRRNYDTLSARPALSRTRKLRLLIRAVAAMAFGGWRAREHVP